MSTGTDTKGEVSQESKDAVHDALFGGDKDEDQAKNGSQSGSQTDDGDDDDLDDDESDDGSSGTEDQDDDTAEQIKKLSEKLKLSDRRAVRAEEALRKLKGAARGADRVGSDDKSGDKDKGDGDVDERIAAAKLEAKIEYSEQLVATRLEAALEALNVQGASDIVEDLNLSRYITEEGGVDKEKLTAKIEQFKQTYRRRRSTGHGNSGGDKGSGATNADRFAEAIGL